jgi:tRNA threonylcarbamoyladenosine biosynthesis protein TsaE
MIKIISNSPIETIKLGKRFAQQLKNGDFVALTGILGAGKTLFTKGIAQGLGVSKRHHITSPSFILGNVYKGKKATLHHFDCYRLDNPGELIGLGLRDHSSHKVITVLEWADRFLPTLSAEMKKHGLIKVRFKILGETKRFITVVT